MNMQSFLENFDEIVDAPERIPAARKLILTFLLRSAVNLADAERRAERLREAHREKECTRGGRSSSEASVCVDDIPPVLSGIPASIFERLGNIASIEKGLSQIQKTKPGDYPLVVTAEARATSDSYDFEGPAAIIPMVSSTGHGDASLKRIHYQEGRYAVGNILSVVQPLCPDLIRARFIYEYLSAFKEELLVSRMVGTANVSLTINKLKEVPIPLVSGNWLDRVVELMGLFDRLEAQLQEREIRHAELAKAALARFAEAPNPANVEVLFQRSFSVSASDLRKTILALAVQGALVNQQEADGDAAEEMELIQSRKLALIHAKAIRASEPSKPLSKEEFDHEIPTKWKWVRLIDICELITDGTHQTPRYTASGRMFLSAQNVKPFRFMPQKHRFVSEEDYQGYIRNRKPERGDILLTRVGAGIGEAAVIDQDLDFAIYVSLGLIRPMRGYVDSEYLTLWLNSPDGTAKSSHGTLGKGVSQGNLNLSLIRNFRVPLPPLAEQRRIAAQVRHLTALVDKLEVQLTASTTAAEIVMDALVWEVVSSWTAEDSKRKVG